MNLQDFAPEGSRIQKSQTLLSTPAGLQTAIEGQTILEGIAVSCDRAHNLAVDLGGLRGVIPRTECALGVADGKTREIAILSRVGKPVCFVVTGMEDGVLQLSRRRAQEQALGFLLSRQPGEVLPACVTHLEPFGAFVDIGCGVPSFIGIENISVSRISHPAERFACGQNIYAAVLYTDPAEGRVHLTHRELLGTWAENAACFQAGETVRGIVRSIESYGISIELAPNLSGLAERRAGLCAGDAVSIYIKSILPERMKIKLAVIDRLPPSPDGRPDPTPLRYFITEGRIQQWVYSPPCCAGKYIATKFGEPDSPSCP